MTKKNETTLFDWIDELANIDMPRLSYDVETPMKFPTISEIRNRLVIKALKEKQIVAARAELNLLKDFKALIENRIKIGEQNLIELTSEKKENKPNDYSKITWANYTRNRWETSDGRILYIKNMDSKHIQNCIEFLERAVSNIDQFPSTDRSTTHHLFSCYISKFTMILKDRGWKV